MKKLMLAIALLTAFAATGPAQAKVAKCHIDLNDSSAEGPCDFGVDRGGTFELTRFRNNKFRIRQIDVFVTRPGVGEYRLQFSDGTKERWGRVLRSREEPACWIGEAIGICVR